jgi:hypothetical protein
MIIETKLEFKKYLKLMYLLTYRKVWTIVITVIGIVMLIGSILYFIGYPVPVENPPFAQLIVGLLVILIPVSVYLSSRKNFISAGKLQEKMTYEFTYDKIIITGETFKTEMTWTRLYKIQEFKNWILIYQSKTTANVIPKESFGEGLTEFKRLVIENNIKCNFKRI